VNNPYSEMKESSILISLVKKKGTIVKKAPSGGLPPSLARGLDLEPPTIRHAPRNVARYNCLALNQRVRGNRLSLYLAEPRWLVQGVDRECNINVAVCTQLLLCILRIVYVALLLLDGRGYLWRMLLKHPFPS
jgi:hypothetical protein